MLATFNGKVLRGRQFFLQAREPLKEAETGIARSRSSKEKDVM
jgi:hypothetical protein